MIGGYIIMINQIKNDAKQRMEKSIQSLKTELAKLRTGRAQTNLLDHIKISYYGNLVPLNQVANLSVTDSRTITLSPWEKNMVSEIEKAILNSDLGLNPTTSGTIIRVILPPLTEERRKELTKVVKHEGENAKIAIRNIRRDANTSIKDGLKEKEITEDESRRAEEDMQKLTDQFIQEVDSIISKKEQDLMEI
jgi:ribosome recycling factor